MTLAEVGPLLGVFFGAFVSGYFVGWVIALFKRFADFI